MNRFFVVASVFMVLAFPLPTFACGFCSGKPKSLSNGGNPTQDPGYNSQNSGSNYGANSSGGFGTQGSKSPFTSDLKNYKPTGQRSNNEKWNSGDFFDNR